MRPETITSWDRGRDQDNYCETEDRDRKKGYRDHAGLETLTSLNFAAVYFTFVQFILQLKLCLYL